METIKRSGRYKIKYDVPFVTKYLILSKKTRKINSRKNCIINFMQKCVLFLNNNSAKWKKSLSCYQIPKLSQTMFANLHGVTVN